LPPRPQHQIALGTVAVVAHVVYRPTVIERARAPPGRDTTTGDELRLPFPSLRQMIMRLSRIGCAVLTAAMHAAHQV
jgi:hypothetical protein